MSLCSGGFTNIIYEVRFRGRDFCPSDRLRKIQCIFNTSLHCSKTSCLRISAKGPPSPRGSLSSLPSRCRGWGSPWLELINEPVVRKVWSQFLMYHRYMASIHRCRARSTLRSRIKPANLPRSHPLTPASPKSPHPSRTRRRRITMQHLSSSDHGSGMYTGDVLKYTGKHYGPGEGPPAGSEPPLFWLERSSSGRATCKDTRCKQRIEMGTIRVRKDVVTKYFEETMRQYYHAE